MQSSELQLCLPRACAHPRPQAAFTAQKPALPAATKIQTPSIQNLLQKHALLEHRSWFTASAPPSFSVRSQHCSQIPQPRPQSQSPSSLQDHSTGEQPLASLVAQPPSSRGPASKTSAGDKSLLASQLCTSLPSALEELKTTACPLHSPAKERPSCSHHSLHSTSTCVQGSSTCSVKRMQQAPGTRTRRVSRVKRVALGSQHLLTR